MPAQAGDNAGLVGRTAWGPHGQRVKAARVCTCVCARARLWVSCACPECAELCGPPHRPVETLPVNVCQAQPGLNRPEPLPVPSSSWTSAPLHGSARPGCGPLHTRSRPGRCPHLVTAFLPPLHAAPGGPAESPVPRGRHPLCQVPRPGRGTTSHRAPYTSQPHGAWCPGRLRGTAPPQDHPHPGPPQAACGVQTEPLLTADGPPGWGRPVFCASTRAGQLESPGPSAEESLLPSPSGRVRGARAPAGDKVTGRSCSEPQGQPAAPAVCSLGLRKGCQSPGAPGLGRGGGFC